MRGTNYTDTYSSSSIIVENLGSSVGIAQQILDSVGIPHSNAVTGDPLNGYDIKSQDSINMLRLSLLAQGVTSEGLAKFQEIYMGPTGIAQLVKVGEAPLDNPQLSTLFLQTVTSEFVNKIDHVLVKGKDPLPTRYNAETINVMGKGFLNYFTQGCSTGVFYTKEAALVMEAWAEFETSPQDTEMQKKLRLAVHRSKWEQLVGYKIRFNDIPNYASMSQSQTTPKQLSLGFIGAVNVSIPVEFQPDEQDSGVIDISGISVKGAAVLDLVTWESLKAEFGSALGSHPEYDVDPKNTYFALLDHQCGLLSLNRGENWYVLPTDINNNKGVIYIRSSGASSAIWDIYNGISNSVSYFRRIDGSISTISDMVKKNLAEDTIGGPLEGPEGLNAMSRGLIVAGLGGDKGLEVSDTIVSYVVSKPSIQIRSPFGDAPNIAANIANGGVLYTPIILQDIPAPTGWASATSNSSNSTNNDGSISNATNFGVAQLVYPVAPPDPQSINEEEDAAYNVDSPIDNLTGSIIELTAPFLGENGVLNFANSLYNLINGDSGNYVNYSYAGGGYNLLPGMGFYGGIIHTIEFVYNDKDSITTNITTGPRYYSVGSYTDSQYVRRSETLTRTARVINGSNSEGIFFVHVDGRGTFEAINGISDPIFAGDRVEVKMLNVPMEKG